MKIRTDFVTNSSSSSFVLARTSALNDKQKEEILKYVEKTFLGECILTPQSTEEEIHKAMKEEYYINDEDELQKVKDALQEGKSVYYGCVSYEECEYEYANVFEKIWTIMREHGEGNFIEIDNDLSY